MRSLRRRLPTELIPARQTFDRVLAILEPAKAALTQVVPTMRVPGRPFPEAAATFAVAVGEAEAAMAGWRVPALESDWLACAAGLREARRRALTVPEPQGFEAVIGTVEHLLDQLDPFVDAARHFDALRERAR